MENTKDTNEKSIVQVLVDRHFECQEEKLKLWDTALDGMGMLDTEHFEAVRKVAFAQGEQLAISYVLDMLTSPEDTDHLLGRV